MDLGPTKRLKTEKSWSPRNRRGEEERKRSPSLEQLGRSKRKRGAEAGSGFGGFLGNES